MHVRLKNNVIRPGLNEKAGVGLHKLIHDCWNRVVEVVAIIVVVYCNPDIFTGEVIYDVHWCLFQTLGINVIPTPHDAM